MAQAFDFRGNASAIVTNKYFLKVLSPLTISKTGTGTSRRTGPRLI